MLEYALAYTAAGWPVFPVEGKIPLSGTHGHLDATTDEKVVRAWWGKHPSANIALSITEDLVVLDVDPRHRGDATLSELQEAHGPLPETLTSITGGGGHHYFFRGRQLSTRLSIAPGLDFKANGYVLLPPSIHPVTEKRYEWLLEPEESELADIPEWLSELVRAAKTHGQWLEAGDKIHDGMRNTTLTSLGGHLRRISLSEQAIFAALSATNMERCEPPLPERELSAIARSVSKYKPDQFATATAEGWAQEPPEEDTGPGCFPEELLEVPGFVKEMIGYNLEGAYRPQPVLALAGALACLSLLTGRKIRDEAGTRTNLYVLSLGETGAGKERARQVNKKILTEQLGIRSPDGIGSGAGLVAELERNPACLFQVDEMGRFLQTTGSATRSPWLHQINTNLLRLYSAGSAPFETDAYTDPKRAKVIHQPHVCLHGTTTPSTLFETLTPESLTDGFLPRFLVFEPDDHYPERERRPKDEDPLPELVAEARTWWELNPGGNLASVHPDPRKLEYEDEAQRELQAFDDLCDARRKEARADRCLELWTRAAEKARKLALLHAASSEGPEVRSVAPEAVRWAVALVSYLTERLIHQVRQEITSNEWEKLIVRVKDIIRREGGRIEHRRLVMRTRFLRDRERKEILEHLLVTGEWRQEQGGKSGRSVTYLSSSVQVK